jgi:hypothetical protein
MILLLPLASRCLSLFGHADSVINRPLPARTPGLGDWAPMIGDAVFQPQGLAVTAAEVKDGTATFVGLWIDGWLADERRVEVGTAEILAPGHDWSASGDAEVVVRARDGEGAWGPPRRLIMPAASTPIPTELDTGATLVHVPEAGEFLAEASWLPATLATSSPGRLFCPAGNLQLQVADLAQHWKSEPARDLDVYY